MQSPKKKKDIPEDQNNPYQTFLEEDPKTTEQGPLLPKNEDQNDDEIGPWNDFMSPKFTIPSARLNSSRKAELAKTFDKPISYTMKQIQRPQTNEKKSRTQLTTIDHAINKTPSNINLDKDLIFENEFIRNKIEAPTPENEIDIPKIDLASASSAKVIRSFNMPSKRDKKPLTVSYYGAQELENPFRDPEILDYRTMDDRRPRGAKRPHPFFQGKITPYNLYNFGIPVTNTIFHHVIEGEGFTPKIPGNQEKTESGGSTNHGPPPQNHPIHSAPGINPNLDRNNNESPMLATTNSLRTFFQRKNIEYRAEDITPRKTAGAADNKELFDISGKKSGLHDVRDRFNSYQQEKINKVIEREERRRLEKEKINSIDQSAISKQEEAKSRLKILKKINNSVPRNLKKFRPPNSATTGAKIVNVEMKSPKNSTPTTPTRYLFPVVSSNHGTPNLKKILDVSNLPIHVCNLIESQHEKMKKLAEVKHDSKDELVITDLHSVGINPDRPLIESHFALSSDGFMDRSKTRERFSHHVHQHPLVDPPGIGLEGTAVTLTQVQSQLKHAKSNPMMPLSMTQSSIFPSHSKQTAKASNLRPSFSHKNRSLKPSPSMENTLSVGFGTTKKVL
jgi:hypothetical protein